MKEKKTKISFICDAEMADIVEGLAKRLSTSKAEVVRMLVNEAIEIRADQALGEIAEKRLRDNDPIISHEQAWEGLV